MCSDIYIYIYNIKNAVYLTYDVEGISGAAMKPWPENSQASSRECFGCFPKQGDPQIGLKIFLIIGVPKKLALVLDKP